MKEGKGVCLCVCLSVFTCVCTRVCMHVYAYKPLHLVCVLVSLFVCGRRRVCLCVCMCCEGGKYIEQVKAFISVMKWQQQQRKQ